MDECKNFIQAISAAPIWMKEDLEKTPAVIQKNAREIRMRVGKKIMICTGTERYESMHRLKKEELTEIFRSFCGYSVHTHIEEIRKGYLLLPGGHRAGICGTAVYQDCYLQTVRNISSVNLRIARQIKGVSDELFRLLNVRRGKILIVGPPASGKTTLLKDIIPRLWDRQVSVIDSRGEIAACMGGVAQNDMGNADIFDGWKKADGMLTAIRTMGPDLMICDEIGDEEDIKAIMHAVNAGVSLIATAHADGAEEFKKRQCMRPILESGAFEYIVFLEGGSCPCRIKSIYKAEDLYAYHWRNTHCGMSGGLRIQHDGKFN